MGKVDIKCPTSHLTIKHTFDMVNFLPGLRLRRLKGVQLRQIESLRYRHIFRSGGSHSGLRCALYESPRQKIFQKLREELKQNSKIDKHHET